MIIALQTLVFFRGSLLNALDRLLSPYYKRLTGSFSGYDLEEEEENEEVFAEFDDEKGVVFFPPVYAQRYAAISDCLMDERWSGKLAKIVDLGYHDMSFIKYLKDLPGVECIYGVDLESIPLRCSSDLLDCSDYGPKREKPLKVTLFQGNAADPDYRLLGCDAVVAIEMIEHMLPHDLERLVHTIFGFIKPWVTIITTPNGDFNELFKSLEKNGFRRLDHFFEWSREQFHDWCSNIVSRYPSFTVTCQGVGPGPPGTEHLGCCSQLALFVNKQYTKQQEVDLNSLALISNVPSPHNLTDLVDGFKSPSPISEKMILNPKDNADSLTDFLSSEEQSFVTLVLCPSPMSYFTFHCQDKASQCNMDAEVGKNFLMFNDEEMYYTILKPQRRGVDHKVYEIEDVNSRLNCTTFQARKFSKTTQNLMAKNRIDSFAHTREVISEISQLTKMLNFNKETLTQGEGTVWCNINWGEDAPYWNQYYKVVKDYKYPFEEKSEDSRILDLIWEEINRLIDMRSVDGIACDGNKLEIPMEHIMDTVRHVTDDVDKVKDLLEWNGYEVAGNFVVYSRTVVDAISIGSTDVDWPENETTSELETIDGQSTTISDGSALAPEIYGRYLYRALDKKVQGLRKMMSADEDITTELDRVVCRLIKLALRASRGKQYPPPAKWMQCKMLDLLTLTERAVSRRKLSYLTSCPKKMFEIDKNESIYKKIMEDCTAKSIVDKYNHLIQQVVPDPRDIFDDLNFGFEDKISEQFDSKNFFKDKSLHDTLYSPRPYLLRISNGDVSILNRSLELYPDAPDQQSFKDSGKKRSYLQKESTTIDEVNKISLKRSHSKIASDEYGIYDIKFVSKKSKTSVVKKPVRPKVSSQMSLKLNGKKRNKVHRNYATKSSRESVHNKLQPTASKPIPGSLIELCHPEVNLLHSKNFNYSLNNEGFNNHVVKDRITDVSAIEESGFIHIIMDDKEDIIALRRSVGTDPDFDCTEIEQEIMSEVANDNKYCFENVHSQTIFLNDINEPSTSKGVRHTNADVQCGTDTVLSSSDLLPPPPPVTSVTKLPKIYSTGIRISSTANIAIEKITTDFGISPNKVSNIEDYQDNLQTTTFGSITKDICKELINSTAAFYSGIESKYSDFPVLPPNDIGAHPKNVGVMKFSAEVILKEEERALNMELNPGLDFYSNTDDFNFATSRTNSHETIVQKNDSLANLLISVDSQKWDCSSPDWQSRCSRSPLRTNYSYSIKSSDIRIRDSTTNINNSELSIQTSGHSKNETLSLESGQTNTQTETGAQCSLSKQCEIVNSVTIRDKIQEKKKNIYCGNVNIDSLTFPKRKETVKNDVSENLNPPISIQIRNHRLVDSTKIKKKVEFLASPLESMSSNINSLTPIPLTSDTEYKKEERKTKIDVTVPKFSSSDYCLSPERVLKSTFSSDKNKSGIQELLRRNSEEEMSPTKRALIKLSCGGVHVHSFKERQLSEDIVYQGEWKRNTYKLQRKTCRTIVAKKVAESVKKYKVKRELVKHQLQVKQINMKNNTLNEPNKKKLPQIRNPKTLRVKQEIINKDKEIKKNPLPNTTKVKMNNIKASSKIASKTMSSTITSKNVKTARSDKKPPNCTILKQMEKNVCCIKSEYIRKRDLDAKYLPLYLRKTKAACKDKLNKSDSIQTAINVSQINTKDDYIILSDTEEIKSSLLKVQDNFQNSINYLVFRNDIESSNPTANSSQTADITNRNENNRRVIQKRSSSPISQTSSNCSTSDSIATIRTNNWTKTTRRLSNSSNKSSFINTDSESSQIVNNIKNRKFSKKTKVCKKSENNKENLPESSKKYNSEKERCMQNIKNLVRNKTVFMNERHQNPTKSNIKIPAVSSSEERKTSKVATVIKKNSLLSNGSISNMVNKSESSDLVLLIEPQKDHIKYQDDLSQRAALEDPVLEVVDSKLLSEWFERGNSSTTQIENAILAQMRQLVEERLEFVGNSIKDTSFDDNTSQFSYKTAIPAEETYLSKTLISENLMNSSIDAVLGDLSDYSLPHNSTTDVDLVSYKSVISTSKYSDYYMAESNPSKSGVKSASKDLTPKQHPSGAPVQVFSGFSMDIENFIGDQSQLTSIDSGRSVLDVNQQVTSEEMFLSGRSSATYESCVVEEEVAVPDWLFHVMNPHLAIDQQRPDSVASFDSETGSPALRIGDIPHRRPRGTIDEDDDIQELVSLRLPMVEPGFDENGNVVENVGIGLGAGAGDGRGIHSDNSHQSSGRGSTLSSSDASSGQHSEAILIDPSAYTGQFEHFHEEGIPIGGATLVVPVGSPAPSRHGRNDGAIVSTSRNVSIRIQNPAWTSDGEADVSSLDTDVPDSS